MRTWYHRWIAAGTAGLLALVFATGATAERTQAGDAVVDEVVEARGDALEASVRSRELDDELERLATKLDGVHDRIEKLAGPPPGDREFRRPIGTAEDDLEAADTALEQQDLETARTRIRDARRILEGLPEDLEVFEGADETLSALRTDVQAHRADTRLERHDWMPDSDRLRYQLHEAETAIERLDEQVRARESARNLEEARRSAETAVQDLERTVEATDRPYEWILLAVLAGLALVAALMKLNRKLFKVIRTLIATVRGHRQFAQTLAAQDRVDRWQKRHENAAPETREARDELDDLIARYGLQPVQAAFEPDELEVLGATFAVREAARETGDRLERLLDAGDGEAIDEYLEEHVEIGAGEFDGTTVLETRLDEIEEIERERLATRLQQLASQLQPIVDEVASRLEDRAGQGKEEARDQDRDRDPESIW